ncbi:MAG: 2-oxoacid:acceptor oxidoreductase family protein, partial [Planctomycetota bacterium]
DETLLDSEDVESGLLDDDILLVNTARSPEEVRDQLDLAGRAIYTIDATGIALEEIGRPIPNTVMIGALLGVTNAVPLEEVEKSIRKKFEGKLSEGMLQGNIDAAERAYEEVQGE